MAWPDRDDVPLPNLPVIPDDDCTWRALRSIIVPLAYETTKYFRLSDYAIEGKGGDLDRTRKAAQAWVDANIGTWQSAAANTLAIPIVYDEHGRLLEAHEIIGSLAFEVLDWVLGLIPEPFGPCPRHCPVHYTLVGYNIDSAVVEYDGPTYVPVVTTVFPSRHRLWDDDPLKPQPFQEVTNMVKVVVKFRWQVFVSIEVSCRTNS